MTQHSEDSNISRRSFLKASALTAAAATATGAGAALLRDGSKPAAILPAALPAPAVVPPPSGVEVAADMISQLAALQADNVRLQAQLDASQRRLQAADSAGDETVLLRAELDDSIRQVGVLSGLLALYEQLDEVDLGAALDAGLASLSGSISSLIDDLPGLDESIEAGRQALDDIENHIPALEDGRKWLETQSDVLQQAHAALELVLQNVVEAAGAFLQMLDEWFKDILKWLPFGLGRKASQVMQAMTALLLQTPQTAAGMREHVVDPMNLWLREEAGETPLRRSLIKPLREQALARSSAAAEKARQVETVYAAEVETPARAAADARLALRQSISDYRNRHQV